jgi:uncharacterized protein YdeI (YjbR/CyaY-like superfamily)
MEPIFFATPSRFRAWLERHHDRSREVLVGFYKKGSGRPGRPSMTWREAVDEALCFGWIDGVRRTIDDERSAISSYEQRHAAVLDPAYERRFRRDRKAWSYFESRPPSYRKAAIHWGMSAKQERTRERRLARLLEDSGRGTTVPPLTPPAKRTGSP